MAEAEVKRERVAVDPDADYLAITCRCGKRVLTIPREIVCAECFEAESSRAAVGTRDGGGGHAQRRGVADEGEGALND